MRTTSGLAVAALVTALLGLSLPALVLGAVALVTIGRRGQKGRGMAVAGVVLGVLGSLLWCAVIAAGAVAFHQIDKSRHPARDGGGQLAGKAKVDLNALKPGDCVADVTEGEISQVDAVPCGQPHEGRVYATFELPAGPWPGEAEAGARSEQGCTHEYKTTGAQATPGDRIMYFAPVEVRWSLGDRKVSCLVVTKKSG